MIPGAAVMSIREVISAAPVIPVVVLEDASHAVPLARALLAVLMLLWLQGGRSPAVRIPPMMQMGARFWRKFGERRS